jgi:hypothetical protein
LKRKIRGNSGGEGIRKKTIRTKGMEGNRRGDGEG